MVFSIRTVPVYACDLNEGEISSSSISWSQCFVRPHLFRFRKQTKKHIKIINGTEYLGIPSKTCKHPNNIEHQKQTYGECLNKPNVIGH